MCGELKCEEVCGGGDSRRVEVEESAAGGGEACNRYRISPTGMSPHHTLLSSQTLLRTIARYERGKPYKRVWFVSGRKRVTTVVRTQRHTRIFD